MLENLGLFFWIIFFWKKKLKELNFEPQMTKLPVLINFRQHLETFLQLKNFYHIEESYVVVRNACKILGSLNKDVFEKRTFSL